MGSCISKCRPKNSINSEKQEEEKEEKFNHVQDKLVIISQPSICTNLQNSTPLYKIPNKISPSSPSPSASSSSVSSFTTCPYSSKTTTSSSSSSTSSSSSLSSLKDVRSFSNDFLWSCYKENPHIIRINSIKQCSSNNNNITTSFSSFSRKLDRHSPQKVPVSNVVTSQKRVRSSSPSSIADNLTRQKSFRRDIQPEKLNSRPSRRLTSRSSSPSPSRRFVTNGDNYKCTHSKRTAPHYSLGSSRRVNAFGGNYSDSTTSYYSRKESLRRTSPSRNDVASRDRMIRPSLRTGDQPLSNIFHRIGSKIDEIAVGEAMITDNEIDSVLMEDIDNPSISLDCFIFL